MTTHPRYVLVLEAVPQVTEDGVALSADYRLRRALKALWRQHRLRCVSVKEVEPEPKEPT